MKRKRGDSNSSRPGSSPSRPKTPTKPKPKKRRQAGNGKAKPGPSKQIAASRKTKIRWQKHRFEGCYKDEYRLLFNNDIRDLQKPGSQKSEDSKLKTSQIGGTIWTPEEKEIFFSSVARYGRDPSRIANAVGKSELEVSLYITILDGEAAAPEFDIQTDHRKIPAAAEVTKDCCKALELAGEALAWKQFTQEIQKEKEEHGDLWLLTSENGDAFNRSADTEGDQVEDDDEDEEMDSNSPLSETKPTLGSGEILSPKGFINPLDILDLPTLLELSKTVFMNSASPDQRWETHINTYSLPPDILEKSLDSPGIFHTALEDFATLTTTLTKRLIAAAQYQAQSRMRLADTNLTIPPEPFITVEEIDVLAAIDILGLKRNTFGFWEALPKRHEFVWVWTDSRGNKPRVIDPKIAVAALKEDTRAKFFDVAERLMGEAAVEAAEEIGEPGMSGRSSADTSSKDGEDDRSEGDGDAEEEREDEDDEEAEEKEQDAQLEALDHANSLTEERWLWDMLGKDPPPSPLLPHKAANLYK